MSDPRTLRIDHNPFSGLDRMSRHLGYHARRQEMIAGNLANLDTPGYRSKDIVFHEQFSSEIRGGEMRRSMSHRDETVVRDDEQPDQDGNSVSLEKQMARSASNTMRFQALAELLSRKIGMLKYAAGDGRGQ